MTDYKVLRGLKLQLPLAQLIHSRMQLLGLSAEDLGFRLGYQNPAKGAGRVLALCDGHLNNGKSRGALHRLPGAMEVSEKTVQEALRATQETIAELHRQAEQKARIAHQAVEAQWRANFRPHAVIDTESKRPSQITMCALSGGIERWLVVRLDLSKPPITFVRQTIDAIPKMLPANSGRLVVPSSAPCWDSLSIMHQIRRYASTCKEGPWRLIQEPPALER